MSPRILGHGDEEDEDDEENEENEGLPVRDRPYESFGQQGLALPTYGEGLGLQRGEDRVDLGEPPARPLATTPTAPKGWQRRDDRIHEEVCVRLTGDGSVDASDVEVIVHEGEVTLSGTVGEPHQVERAVRIAEGVRGVVDVICRVRVSGPTDAWRGRSDVGSRR